MAPIIKTIYEHDENYGKPESRRTQRPLRADIIGWNRRYYEVRMQQALREEFPVSNTVTARGMAPVFSGFTEEERRGWEEFRVQVMALDDGVVFADGSRIQDNGSPSNPIVLVLRVPRGTQGQYASRIGDIVREHARNALQEPRYEDARLALESACQYDLDREIYRQDAMRYALLNPRQG